MNIEEILLDKVFAMSDLDEKNEITLSKSLLDQGVLDSLGILELIEYIEEKWNLKIEDEEFNQDNFGSINKMEKFISAKLKK